MATRVKYSTYLLTTTTDLPAALTREIGRIMVLYAAIEHTLSRIIYHLLRLSRQEGRLAVREPRASDRFELICDLLELSNVTVIEDLDDLDKAIKRCLTERDRLAHGIWTLHPKSGRPYLRLTRGQWQPFQERRGKVKRLLNPEGTPFTDVHGRELRQHLQMTLTRIDHLAIELGMADEPPSP